MREIFKEGEERFKNKVPPGFEDEKTKEGSRKFGDLILWKQIIQKAKEINKDVILITDERKIDWWWKIKDGRNMGPRQELVEEIKLQANVDFHMYSSERFLRYGQSFLNEKINQQALQEIQAMKKAELEEIKRIQFMEKRMFERELKAKEEINFLSKEVEEINHRIFSIRKHQEELFRDSMESDDVKEYLHSMSIHEAELNEEKMQLISQLNSIHNRLNESEIESKEDKMRFLKYFNDFKHRKG